VSESFILESQIRLPYRYAVGKWYGAFLLGLTEERLIGSRCGSCGTIAVPARAVCPQCSAASDGLVVVGPHGTVVAAARDARGAGKAWLLVKPDGADTCLLTFGAAEPGSTVEPEFDPAAGAVIEALRGFRPVA
jgi:uncharacterized OB-fold protein